MPQPGRRGDHRFSEEPSTSPASAAPKIRLISVRLPQLPLRQIACTSLPCSSTTSRLPADWWKPSTFCVTTMSTQRSFSSSATARWPSFAPLHPRRRSLNSFSKSQTFAGSPAIPAMLDTSMASYRFQSPLPSRYVGTPLSFEVPAPVKARTPPSAIQPAATVYGLSWGAKPWGSFRALLSSSRSSYRDAFDPAGGLGSRRTSGSWKASMKPSG
mmetsp:Transcript_37823/g.102359  ORF Transcript_37823/g.102359 Transcript_37823/m.102359 type:complete len:214 (-) Transcript_37823:737-1378(-)